MSSLFNLNLINVYTSRNLRKVIGIQYTEENKHEVINLLKNEFKLDTYEEKDNTLLVNKLPGGDTNKCRPSNYILIREGRVDVYPSDMFHSIYKTC
jgi:hypothetical protein